MRNILLLEIAEKIKKQLIIKFQKQDSQAKLSTIETYIDNFDRFKSNAPNADITSYSWQKLKDTVDDLMKDKSVLDKGDVENRFTNDPNLLYNKDGIVVLKGSDKESAIQYSKGLNYCIGNEEGARNQYNTYRKKGGGATPYFIYNINVSKKHRYAVCVIYTFTIDTNLFSLTDAYNDHENELTFRTIDVLVNYFGGNDKYGKPIWGMKATFLPDVLGVEPLKSHELYEDFVDKGTHFEISSADLSGQGLTELPKYWEIKL